MYFNVPQYSNLVDHILNDKIIMFYSLRSAGMLAYIEPTMVYLKNKKDAT